MSANSNAFLLPAETEYLGNVLTEQEQSIVIVGKGQPSALQAKALSEHYEVFRVENVTELFSLANQNNVELILFNAASEQNAWIADLAKIRSHSLLNFIPLLVLTQSHALNEQLVALELGALDCLKMPTHPALLLAKINNLMNLIKSVKEIEQISCTDGLTGLANRMQLDTTITKEWFRMQRCQQAFSVLMIDVDHFKLFNDKFGHLQGDEALKKVAKALRSVANREADFVARYGGEEFVILLPCTDLAGAKKLAESVLAKVQALKLASAHLEHEYLSVSIGIATCTPHKIKSQTFDSAWLLNQADKKLYKAKEAGRNQFAV
ncbi:GGDEF domain-containing protein [Paraglaciecola aestuariivivens]